MLPCIQPPKLFQRPMTKQAGQYRSSGRLISDLSGRMTHNVRPDRPIRSGPALGWSSHKRGSGAIFCVPSEPRQLIREAEPIRLVRRCPDWASLCIYTGGWSAGLRPPQIGCVGLALPGRAKTCHPLCLDVRRNVAAAHLMQSQRCEPSRRCYRGGYLSVTLSISDTALEGAPRLCNAVPLT